MEDEYNDAVNAVETCGEQMRADHLELGHPTADILRRDIAALESIAADLRALLARAETEAT